MRVGIAKGSLLVLVIALLATALAASASAAGVETHYFSSSIGHGELSLEERSGVVFDEATEHLYVADTGHDRIARYGAAGEPLTPLATLTAPTFLALDNSTGDLYAVAEGNETITKLDSSGSPITAWGTAGRLSGFGKIAGIAVDQSGSLFVVGTDYVMHELTSAGGQTNQCELAYHIVSNNGHLVEQEVRPRGIAVDAEENIYFPWRYPNPTPAYAGTFVRGIAKMTSACVGITERLFENASSSAAVDETDDSVFLANSHEEYEGGPGDFVAHVTSTGQNLSREFGGDREGVDKAGQLAVRSADETVYLVNLGAKDISVFPVGEFEPPTVQILPPTDISGTTAHLHATINPEAPQNLPAWEVQYAFGCLNVETGSKNECTSTSTEGRIPAEPTPEEEEVEVTVTGLQPASEYEVYVTATNIAGATARSPEEPVVGLPFQTGAAAPVIEEEGISAATETSVTVAGQINPRGAETGYWVEYVTRLQFEASEFAGAQRTAKQFLPAGIKGQPVAVTVDGLTSLSQYVVRLVASNTVEGSVETVFGEALNSTIPGPLSPFVPGSCPNEAFRTEGSALLPDCRAYEQASPVNKGGGSVEALPGSIQAPGGAGDAISFYSQSGIPGGVGAQDYPTFLATRGGGSWSTTGLLPPQELGERAAYLGLTPDGRYSVTEARRAGEESGVFLRDLGTGEITTVVPYETACIESCFTLAGASEDDSEIFLETRLELDQEPPTVTGPPNVYMWDRDTGKFSLVSADQNGARLPAGAFAGPYSWANGDLEQGGARGNQYVAASNAISADGEEVVFTARGAAGNGQLYARLGLGGSSPTSVKVSAYAAGQSGAELPAAFLEATPNGRYVFFKSKAQLTKDAYAGDGEGTESLYRYDTSTGKLTNVTTEAKAKFEKGPGVVGMLGASDSGNVVYFTATTELTASPGPGGATAQAGQANLYRWEEGASRPISFIAALKNGPLYGATVEGGESDSRDWSPSIVEPNNEGNYTAKAARVSADGGAVVFSSHRSLTGVPNLARACNSGSSNELAPCPEFFRYSSASRALDCLSCNPTGERPINGASIGTAFINAADLTSVLAEPTIPRNLSADGNRFFFQTPDSLVPGDHNRPGCSATAEEKESCLDVYEWEAPGTPNGSCRVAEINGGCLYLISSGEGHEPSYFGDADPEGENAFILTASQLLPSDRDELYDVYDASVKGGLASQHETPGVPCGSRTSCQGATATTPEGTTPGSSTLVGTGNVKPRSCKKGFVRRQGKCIKKAKHHKKEGKSGKKKQRADGGRGGKK